jgi:hypothetical protein
MSFSNHGTVAPLDVSVFRAKRGEFARQKTLHDPCRTAVSVANEGKPKIVRDLRGKLGRRVPHRVRGRSFSFRNIVLLLDRAQA